MIYYLEGLTRRLAQLRKEYSESGDSGFKICAGLVIVSTASPGKLILVPRPANRRGKEI
jgi:hypothetical protein